MNKEYNRLRLRLFWTILALPIGAYLGAVISGYGILLFFEDPLRWLKRLIFDSIFSFNIMEHFYFIAWSYVFLWYLVLLYFFSGKIAGLFDVVAAGVKKIEENGEEAITLPKELKPMEDQLNLVKQTMRRKSLETKLAEQQKSDLVVYLAHDLKTPLTSIIGYSNIIYETPDLPPEMNQKYNGIVYQKAKRMEGLLDELFEVSRFNAQSVVLTKSLVDVNMMLEQLAEEFYPQLVAKELDVALKIDGHFRLVLDGDQMARVFDNLLRNAVHYSEPASTIKIQMYAQDNWLNIFFSNYGVTIPEEKLTRIFEKFYRADESRSTESGGSGLGLAIAKTIVEAHDGQISAESANLWTTFQIKLPINAEEIEESKEKYD